MTTMSLKSSIKDRTQGIGGSDIHHLFGLKPYGCTRRLWYEKRGVKADYPFLGNNATKRGNRLEALVAEEYTEKTGRVLSSCNLAFKIGDCFVSHVDRLIEADSGDGVLEIKVPGREMFHKIKQEGLSESHILQLQCYLMSTGHKWGAFVIFWADGWELLEFDVKRDDSIIDSIREKGIEFWTHYVQGSKQPERLVNTDKRCGDCPWRYKCQGQHLLDIVEEETEDIPFMEELAIPIQQYAEACEIVKTAEKHKESIKETLKNAMGNLPRAKTIGGKIIYKPVTTMRWDTKTLEAEHPELASKYKKPCVSRPILPKITK